MTTNTGSTPPASPAVRIGIVALTVIIAAAIGFVVFRNPDTKPQPEPEPPEVAATGSSPAYVPPSHEGYVGSTACAECHAELFASYSQHPMYTGSTRRVSDDPQPPGGSKKRIPGLMRSLTSESDGTTMVHHEFTHLEDGQLLYDEAVPMHYVVGSGRRAKAYLYQRDGFLCISPLNFFGESDAWGLSPGYVADDARRFDRRALIDCLQCHTGSLAPIEHGSTRFEAEPFRESHIGCERCHGPGQDHIQHHEEATLGLDPIVNPANLGRTEQESVCYQCHLQPSSARILRLGRSDADFRPGQKLEEIWTVAEAGNTVLAGGQTKSVRQVQQMRESLCFVQSETMSCTTCHDPHRLPKENERVQFFRDRCLQCHENSSGCSAPEASRSEVGNSCMECHMPQRGTELAAHVSQTDHRILRDPNQVRERQATGNSLVRFFDNHDQRLPEAEKRRAIALALAVRGGPYSDFLSDELQQLVEEFPNDHQLLMAHGAVARALGDIDVARKSLERAAAMPASDEMALERLTEMSFLAKKPEDTLKYSEALLKLNPYLETPNWLRANVLLAANRPDEAITAAKRVLELNPSRVEVHRWLLAAYSKLGRADDEARQQELLNKLKDARPLENEAAGGQP